MTGYYVYGIFPAGIEVSQQWHGVGDPPGELRVIESGELAALVSDVDTDKPLGSPEDLRAHQEILDASAADVPVIPLRFGAVLDSEDAITEELLGEHSEELLQALDELDGRVQYVIRGRYVEEQVLAEILTEDSELARLAAEVRGSDPDVTRDARIAIGERISEAIAVLRDRDTGTAAEALDDCCTSIVVREPTHERDAVYLAVLVDSDAADDLRGRLEELASRWEGRIELRLDGPMAAYDFVGTAEQAAA